MVVNKIQEAIYLLILFWLCYSLSLTQLRLSSTYKLAFNIIKEMAKITKHAMTYNLQMLLSAIIVHLYFRWTSVLSIPYVITFERIVKVQNFLLKTSKSKLKVEKEQLLHKRPHSVLHEGTAQVSFRVNGLNKMQINIKYKHAPCTSNIHRAGRKKKKPTLWVDSMASWIVFYRVTVWR